MDRCKSFFISQRPCKARRGKEHTQSLQQNICSNLETSNKYIELTTLKKPDEIVFNILQHIDCPVRRDISPTNLPNAYESKL